MQDSVREKPLQAGMKLQASTKVNLKYFSYATLPFTIIAIVQNTCGGRHLKDGFRLEKAGKRKEYTPLSPAGFGTETG